MLNALVEQKQIEDRRRGFQRPDGARNCLNQLGDEVDAVLAAVRARAALAHRFYRLKANWLGRDVLNYCDRAAPLPAVAAMTFTWQEAKAVVLQAFGVLSPEVAAVAGRFFEEGWIDAAPRPGKVGHSACYATVPSAHPYVVMNYRGAVRDVLSLAHELAHGVHQVLAADNGFLGAAVPPVLAETVAALAEFVVLDTLCQRSTPGEGRDALLALKLEHVITTIFYHAAIHDFEWRIHRARQVGELTPALVNELWILAQREFMGPAVRLDSSDGTCWTCVGHVFRAPFYAYSYVLGGALALSLHGRLVEQRRDVAERYVSLLRLGGRASLTAFLDDRAPSVAALAETGLETLGSILETLESAGPAARFGSGVRTHTFRQQSH
jgi:oligoendopeptidase F